VLLCCSKTPIELLLSFLAMAAAAGGGTLAASSPAPLSSHSCLSASSSSSAGVLSIATGHSSLKLKRQVWNHHSSRVRVFAAGTVQEGDKLSRPSSDGSCGVSVSRRQLVSVPMASICAYLLSNAFASERALASGFADSMPLFFNLSLSPTADILKLLLGP
jgi:hypothetical protein